MTISAHSPGCPGSRFKDRLRAVAARSRNNLVRPALILLERNRSRPGNDADLAWLGGIGLAVLAAALAGLLLDVPVVTNLPATPAWLTKSAKAITYMGLSAWYLYPALLVLLSANLVDWRSLSRRSLMRLYDWTQLAFLVLVAVGLPGLLSMFIKFAVARARPEHFDQLGAFSFGHYFAGSGFASFPSGHATTIGSVTAVLVLLFPWLRYPLVPFAICVAGTRVLTGSHYLSDVLAGGAIGFIGALWIARVLARLGIVLRLGDGLWPVRKRTFRFWRPWLQRSRLGLGSASSPAIRRSR